MKSIIDMFKKPSLLKVAQDQLAVAELELLRAKTQMEFASSMASFNEKQVLRLTAYIASRTEGGN